MHETWMFNTTTEKKVSAYQSVSDVVQSMRNIAPHSGAYFVSGRIVHSSNTDFDTSQNEGDVYEADHTRTCQVKCLMTSR